MSRRTLRQGVKIAGAILPVMLFFFSSLSPLIVNFESPHYNLRDEQYIMPSSEDTFWDDTKQPWGQYARTPTRNGTMPAHGPNGGPGDGDVANVSVYGIIDSPIVNWVALDESADAYGSIIADFSNSISAPDAAKERCGEGELFGVTVWSDGTESMLSLISGDEAKIAWQVSLGQTNDIRSTPIVHDIDDDGKPEIVVVYDTTSALHIEVWSPEITCSESGWQKNGHSNEKVWSFSDSDYRIGITSPHPPTSQSNHRSVTQPLLADLELDGVPELVLSLVDQNSDDPTVVSFSLTTSVPTEPDWAVSLDRGTHPSDPTWTALDSSSTAIVLTTIDSNSGNMWIWRIDGSSGSLDWERVAIQGTDSDSDSPRLRLPGPVIVQLDNDEAPEMILTIPTDANGATSGSGARYVGMELTSTSEIFNFRAQNGYADAQPLPIDTTGDGIHDRLCWVTWYSESSFSFNRKGMIGCHDISLATPLKEWTRDLQRGSGNDNDEIAVSSPIWMDIDGSDEPEIIVAFGQRLWAFDGNTGASADINSQWSSPLAIPHRTWAGPAVADMDGDGTLDILIGDVLVSQSATDFAPLADGRGISFNPTNPDPGQQVTITGQFSNIGTLENDDSLDAVLMLNGNEIARERFDDVEPVSPSGEGGPLTFSTVIDAELGIHNVTMILDVNKNLTESREDNNIFSVELSVVEPYVAQIEIPSEVTRVSPGATETIDITLIATGSRVADWTLSWDESNLPDGWSFTPTDASNLQQTLTPNAPSVVSFEVSIPSDALGDANSFVDLTISYDEDNAISTNIRMPLEVLRTRGLSVTGPSGLSVSDGYGRLQSVAKAWMVVENLGNAQESTASIDWTATSWGGSPSLHTATGEEIFALTLNPNEDRELYAHLDVPASKNLGDSTSTTLTLCIGSGSETLCQNLDVTFTAVATTVEPLHTRSLPNATLSWQIEADLPASGNLRWSMVDAQMIQSGWEWSSGGNAVINGSSIELNGPSGSYVSGTISLVLPPNTVPFRHVFNAPDEYAPHSNLTFSLQVLQIYRSLATLLEPLPETPGSAISMNVSEAQNIRLRLENPGNGEDDFLLTAIAHPIAGEATPPNVDFNFISLQQRTLGSLAYTISTVQVTLGEDVPAQTPFELEFFWSSLGDSNVVDTVSLFVEAEPDHRWEINITSGNSSNVVPSQKVEINFNAKNTGNANDTLRIVPSFTYDYAGMDGSLWTADVMVGSMLEVNESSEFSLNFTVPESVWADSKAFMQFAVYSDQIWIENFNITFEVQHVSGWRFNLANTSLTIDPEGQNLTLNVEQLGNAPRAPYFDKAGAGWNISYPDSGDIVNPDESTTVTVFVTPPENALAGEISILRIRISDSDGSGSNIQDIPIRVGNAPNITVGHKGVWRVNENGGMPTAWVENNGNDVAVLQIGVADLPTGWTTSGPSQMVVAPNQIIGIPLNLIPDENWNGERFLATLEITHPSLGLQLLNIEVEISEFAFDSTPVKQASFGKEVQISMNNIESANQLQSNSEFTVFGNKILISMTNSHQEIILTSSDNPNESYSIYLAGYEFPNVDIDCTLDKTLFDKLGTEVLTGTIGSCEVSSGSELLLANMFLVSSNGVDIELTENSITLGINENGTFDVNVTSWNPDAGEVFIELLVIDSFGRTLENTNLTVVARSSGWNIGIFSFTADEGDLTINIQRKEYQRLSAVTCRINIVDIDSSSSNPWSTVRIVDLVSSDNAPKVLISNVDGVKDGSRLEATLMCDSPYDVDDNPDDNVKVAKFSAEANPAVEQSDLLVIIAVASILLTISYFAGLFNPVKVEQPVVKKKAALTSAAEIVENQDAPIQEVDPNLEEDDEFSFEPITEPAVDSMIEIFESTEEKDVEIEEVIEIEDEMDTSASGRLASLRTEIESGDKKIETREERMKRLFGEK